MQRTAGTGALRECAVCGLLFDASSLEGSMRSHRWAGASERARAATLAWAPSGARRWEALAARIRAVRAAAGNAGVLDLLTAQFPEQPVVAEPRQ